jgi:hypothetical protein
LRGRRLNRVMGTGCQLFECRAVKIDKGWRVRSSGWSPVAVTRTVTKARRYPPRRVRRISAPGAVSRASPEA